MSFTLYFFIDTKSIVLLAMEILSYTDALRMPVLPQEFFTM